MPQSNKVDRNPWLRLPPGHDAKVWFSITDTAMILNTSRSTVHRWIDEKKIPHFKESQVIRIHRDHLEQFITSHMQNSGLRRSRDSRDNQGR